MKPKAKNFALYKEFGLTKYAMILEDDFDRIVLDYYAPNRTVRVLVSARPRGGPIAAFMVRRDLYTDRNRVTILHDMLAVERLDMPLWYPPA